MEAEIKKCSYCNKEKELGEFHKDRTRTSGFTPRCKECVKILYSRSRPRTKEEVSRMIEYAHNNPERIMIIRTRKRAQRLGIPFTLQFGDAPIPEVCPILGIPLRVSIGKKGGQDCSPSLDKIRPELGYIKGNVQVISNKANIMKSNATPEELLKFSNWIQGKYATTIPTTGD